MSVTCELSGVALVAASGNNSPNNDDEIVVTPSGHVCRKRLLLSKLAETGGRDPFENDLQLSEDQLVTLKLPSASSVVPPRSTSVASVPSLLQTLQSDYDAILLELFDTRQLLEQTRRELSQALYENDAAVRVVARLAQERDAARQQLQQWNRSASSGSVVAPAAAAEEASAQEPALKKPRIETIEPSLPLQNSIPDQDLQQMIDTWQELHQGRKARQKQAAAAAPSPEALAKYALVDTTTWMKSSCKGLTAMAAHGSIIASAGKSNKELVLYDVEKKVVSSSHVLSKAITCIDVNESYVVAGCGKSGLVEVFSNNAQPMTKVGSVHLNDDKAVDVRLFPDQIHLVAASEQGSIALCRIDSDNNSQVTPIAVLKQQQQQQEEEDSKSKYTCGALHPDGLIYLAGTSSGQVLIWDLKSQSLAGVLKGDGDDDTNAILQVQISNNGYHIAAATSDKVRVWDLRKQKQLAVLNAKNEPDELKSIESIAFDDSGKYLAYGGCGGICITTVKEWGVTHFLNAPKKKHAIHNLVWIHDKIAASSQKQRNVDFFGVPDDEQEE